MKMENPIFTIDDIYESDVDLELIDLIKLHVKAMGMVTEQYGNTLSHAEFMDKSEVIFCELLEEAKGHVKA